MKIVSRRVGTLLLLGVGVAAAVGCADEGGEGLLQVGEMSLPLTAQAASGTSYRLRNATFALHRAASYYDQYAAGSAEQELAGSSPDNGDVVVSSEADPNARTINVSLEEGLYSVQLRPGWNFEKQTPGGATPVEATLLTGSTQWVWIYRQSTSWAQFSFGIGGREVWLNGKLNIGIDVQEVPGEAGAGGQSNVGPGPVTAGGAGGSEFYL